MADQQTLQPPLGESKEIQSSATTSSTGLDNAGNVDGRVEMYRSLIDEVARTGRYSNNYTDSKVGAILLSHALKLLNPITELSGHATGIAVEKTPLLNVSEIRAASEGSSLLCFLTPLSAELPSEVVQKIQQFLDSYRFSNQSQRDEPTFIISINDVSAFSVVKSALDESRFLTDDNDSQTIFIQRILEIAHLHSEIHGGSNIRTSIHFHPALQTFTSPWIPGPFHERHGNTHRLLWRPFGDPTVVTTRNGFGSSGISAQRNPLIDAEISLVHFMQEHTDHGLTMQVEKSLQAVTSWLENCMGYGHPDVYSAPRESLLYFPQRGKSSEGYHREALNYPTGRVVVTFDRTM